MNEYLKRNYSGSTNAAEIEMFRKCLPVAMQWLSPRQKQIIEMKFFQDMDGVQIAEELGITKQAASKALNAAVAKMNRNITISLQILKSQPK